MTPPLVSVITATYRRPSLLVGRCVPSVQAQTYRNLEHVIVHDGPAPGLWQQIAARLGTDSPQVPVMYDEKPEWVPVANSGVHARRHGLGIARGEFIAYLDDDDAYRPEHCAILAQALIDNPESGFAYSRMASHGGAMSPVSGYVIGGAEPVACGIGTPMIMHRRELADVATWGYPDSMEDWKLVAQWLQRLVKYTYVPEVTVDVWPSTYRPTIDEPVP